MKKFWLIVIFTLCILGYAKVALAICPFCTIGAGLGMGLFYLLGYNVFGFGFLAGGFIISGLIWLFDWLGKQKKITRMAKIPLIALSFLLLSCLIMFLAFSGYIPKISTPIIFLFAYTYGFFTFLVTIVATYLTLKNCQACAVNPKNKRDNLIKIVILFIVLYFSFIFLKKGLLFIFSLIFKL